MRLLPRVGRLGRAALTLGLAVSIAACSNSGDIFDSSGGPPTGPSNLTSSASHPDSGNATLTVGAALIIDKNGGGFDELKLSQTAGETAHEVVVTWNTTTHEIRGASHVWGQGPSHGGPTSGFTSCFAGINDCDPTKVTLDFDGQIVTFTGQVLDDVFLGPATSTLDGTMGW